MSKIFLVYVMGLSFLCFSGTGQGQDLCQQYHDKYRVCVEKRDAGRNLDPAECMGYGDQTSCELAGCYWSSQGLPSGACVTDLCKIDVDFSGKIDGGDLSVFKKELGRVDCPCNPSGDLCQKYLDLHNCCVDLGNAGRNLDYTECRAYSNQTDCEDAGCYWNLQGLPNGACTIDICLSDSDFNGRITGADLSVFKKELGRMDCPACMDIDGDGYDTCNADNSNDTDGKPIDCDDNNTDTHPENIKVCDNNYGPLTSGETLQFSACNDCPENPCYEWSIEPPSTIGSTINPDTGLYAAGTDFDYLDCPVEETIVVTDPCSGDASDTVTVTVRQVVIELLNTNAHLGDGGGQVTVNMCKPDHAVKAIQVDVVDEGNGLTCTSCAPDPYRALQFICLAAEQENGMCRVTLYTTEPDALILEGEGSILTIDYTIDETAPAEVCTDLTIENPSVSDEFLKPLCIYPDGGQICFIACGDVYPREYSPDNPVCGDGKVNLFDELEVINFISGIAEPSYCQRMRADVPTGTPPYCTPPDGEINNSDYLVIHDKILSKMNCCDYYYFGEIY